MQPQPLKPEDLTCRCAESDIPKVTVEDETPALPGQERGLEALEFGLSLKKRWFNITVTGAPGSGKTTTVQDVVRERAEREPPGEDICIHQNFDHPTRPGVLYLPPGGGSALNRLIDELLRQLDKQIPNLIDQQAVKAQIQEIRGAYEEREQELSRTMEEYATTQGIFVQTTPQGVNMIPLRDGKPMKEEEFLEMGVEERKTMDSRRKAVLEKMTEINPQILALEKEKRDAIEKFLEGLVRSLVHNAHQDLRKQLMEEPPALGAFLDSLEKEIVEKRFLFLGEAASGQPFGGAQLQVMRQLFAKQCRLNVLVNRTGQTHAPVVVEMNPSYSNLMGGVNFVEEQGVLKTDFTQIRAGSLLQAAGGYLIVQASDLVLHPVAYYAMKRALRSGELQLRDQGAEMGLRSTTHLEPDAIRFSAKVIVVGSEFLIQTIHSVDDEFSRLFKIHADFSTTLVRTPDVIKQLVVYLEHHSRLNDLLPLETSGIARLVEEASRQVSHQHRLSAQLNYLMDILMEADMIARLEGGFSLNRQVVERALERKKYRHGRIEELVKREISEGTILLDFEGAKVGQVNGLAVYQVGRVAFGVPSRITAQAYAGRSGVINIDREADLSGRIHTKGMLILNGYLGKLFARKRPLALSISVVFEQSYGGIEGDSATAAEFFAIVSAISQVPLRQTIAVTGSMSQHGEIQPIGGVNEKVAGFFQFAREHGFPVGCGVMIPAVNKVNLMLDEEIIEAVREGKFNIYPVRRIEEGLELMTQNPAGELQPDGEYPPDSVFGKTMAQLRAFSDFAKADQDGKGDKGGREKRAE